MRKGRGFVFLLGLVLCCNLIRTNQVMPVVRAQNTAGNLIENGDFEAGSVMEEAASSYGSDVAVFGDIGDSGWDWYTSLAGARFQIIAQDSENPNQVMKISHTSDSSGSGTILKSYNTALQNGVTYSVTLRAKVVNMPAASLNFTLAGQKINDAKLQAAACGDGWYTHTFQYTLTADDTKKRIEIAAYGMQEGGYWLIDDVSLIQVSQGEVTPVDVTEIHLNKSEVSLAVGREETLVATVAPENATDKKCTWMSSNNAVATVSGEGIVRAISQGTTVITVTSDANPEVNANCTVHVTDAGEAERKTPIVKNGDFEKVSNVSVTALTGGNGGTVGTSAIGTTDWSYYMASSYTINMQYDIVAEGRGNSGNAMKISNASGQTATTEGRGVIRQDNITLPDLEAGANYCLTIYAKASQDINDGSFLQLRWVKGDRTKETVTSTVKTVDDDGWSVYTIELTTENSVSTGNGIQIYAWNMGTGYWLIDDVSVKKMPVLSVDKSQVNMELGDTVPVTVSLTDEDEVLGKDPELIWNSENTDIAVVTEQDGQGMIRAVGLGETTVTVSTSDESVSAECIVKVNPKTIIANGDFKVDLEGWITSGEEGMVFRNVAGGRSDNALELAAEADLGRPVSGGFRQILDAKVEEGLLVNRSKYSVTVYMKPVSANSDSAVTVSWFDFEGSEVQYSISQTAGEHTDWIPVCFEFTAGNLLLPGTNLEIQVSNLTSGSWFFDDISVKRVPYIALAEEDINVVVGQRVKIEAELTDPDHLMDKPGVFEYSSDNENIAKVDSRGRITGVAGGTTTIRIVSAYYPEYSCEREITVSEIALDSISLPRTLNLCQAQQQELVVNFYPANATNREIVWNSSDTETVSVDEDGRITGMKAGTAVITATGENNLTTACTVIIHESTTLLARQAEFSSAAYREATGTFADFVTNRTGSKAVYSLYRKPLNGILTVKEDGSYSYIPRNRQAGNTEDFIVIVHAGSEYTFIRGSIEITD